MNILTENFNTPHQTAPFDQIKNEDYLPAFKELIAQSEKEIDDLVNNTEAPTFQNTVEALAFVGEKLEVVSNIFFNLNSAETSDELQQIAQEVSPLLTEHASKISQNEKLFEKIKLVFDQKEKYHLNEEQAMLLTETYKGFVRSGALLNETDKETLKKINMDLSLKSLQFGQNALASTNAYLKHLTNKEDLAGFPKVFWFNMPKMPKKKISKVGWFPCNIQAMFRS